MHRHQLINYDITEPHRYNASGLSHTLLASNEVVTNVLNLINNDAGDWARVITNIPVLSDYRDRQMVSEVLNTEHSCPKQSPGQLVSWLFKREQDMTTKPLPGSLTREQFEQACDELREVLGQKRVYTDDVNELRSYRDVYATLPDEAHMPSAAVAPESVEEIQLILAVARKYTIPLWTISLVKNFAYGGLLHVRPGFSYWI